MPRDLALDEATGIGLMISSREKEVEKLPKKISKRTKSPLVFLKGL